MSGTVKYSDLTKALARAGEELAALRAENARLKELLIKVRDDVNDDAIVCQIDYVLTASDPPR